MMHLLLLLISSAVSRPDLVAWVRLFLASGLLLLVTTQHQGSMLLCHG